MQAESDTSALATLVDEFLAILAAEEKALRTHDLEQIRAVSDLKRATADRLDAALKLLPAGLPDGPEAGALRDRIARCQHQNRINGALIEANRSFNSLLLDALRGGERQSVRVYGRSGAINDLDVGTTLARA